MDSIGKRRADCAPPLIADVRLVQVIRILTLVALGGLLWASMEVLARVNLPWQLVYLLAAPTVVGLIGYATLKHRDRRWRDAWLLGLAATAPLFPIVGMGGDPAKPGLQWILYGPFFLCILFGAFVGWLWHTYVVRRPGSNAQA